MGELPVELGFVEAPIDDCPQLFETPDWADWDGGIVGGSPKWLVPLGSRYNVEQVSEQLHLSCNQCNRPLSFALQIYAPVDNAPQAFHRCLYMFICSAPECNKSGPNSTAKVIRCQLPKENQWYSPDGTSGEFLSHPAPVTGNLNSVKFPQFDLVVEEEPSGARELSEVPSANSAASPVPSAVQLITKGKCSVCSCDAPFSCGACSSVSYCNKEHQKDDWPSHRKFCKLMSKASKSDADENTDDQEGEDGDDEITQEMIDKIVHGDNEKMKQMLDNKDPYFLEFQERVNREPEQCLRYCRWKGAECDGDFTVLETTTNDIKDSAGCGVVNCSAEDATAKLSANNTNNSAAHPANGIAICDDEEEQNKNDPILWFSGATKAHFESGIPTPCENCGSPRQFEFQVMPQLLNYLDCDGLDFGTLVVYTCTKSCGEFDPEDLLSAYMPELVWVNNTPQ